MEEFFTNNFRYRKHPVDTIIVHSMGEYVGEKFAPEFLESINLSADYYILPNGNIIQGNEDPKKLYTFHAGKSEWEGRTHLNQYSIGIELLIEGRHHWGSFKEAIKKSESFTENHYNSLDMLCTKIMKQFPLITTDNILQHSTVSGADVRDDPKIDPGNGWNHDRFIRGFHEKLERKYLKPEVKLNPEDKESRWEKMKKKIRKFKRIMI